MKKSVVLVLSTLEINRFDFFKQYMENHYQVIIIHSLLREDKIKIRISKMLIGVDAIIFCGNVDTFQINQVKKTLPTETYCTRVDAPYNSHNTGIDGMLSFFTLKSAFNNVVEKLFSEYAVSEV